MCQAAMKHPRSIVLYVVQSQDQAKDIIYPAMRKIEDQAKLGMRLKESPLEIIFKNGSKIKLVGGGTMRDIEKLRGPNYPLVCIDEAQSFNRKILDYLITDAVMPALADYGHEGQLVMTGTPNAAKAGFFYDTWVKESGSNHHWTLFENPHMPNPRGFAAQMQKIHGWSDISPTFLREYRGQWVRDESGLVYLMDHHRNVYPGTFDRWKDSAEDWVYTLGIDVGARSCTAFVLIAHSMDTGQAYVVKTEKYGGRQYGKKASAHNMTTSRMAAKIEKYRKDYDVWKVVLDTGGQGAAYQHGLEHEHGIFVDAAEKTKKSGFIEFLNSDLQSGALKICRAENEALVEEIEVLQWDSDKRDQGKLEEDTASSDNHAADAFLYAWRAGAHHALDWELNPARKGTPEWEAAEELRMKENYVKERDEYLESLEWFEEPDEEFQETYEQQFVELYDLDY